MNRVRGQVQLEQSKSSSTRPELQEQFLRTMLLIRAFDSNLPTLYNKGLIQGSSHAAIGQEAVAVGAVSALDPGDFVTSTHRGHGHAIAKGADLARMTAELLGREVGFCRGKGGSMHIADFGINMLGANGIVGGSFGIAAGAALSLQLSKSDNIVLAFFGEGALNQGAFLEVANMAAIWKLPVVFLCENNHYAMSARPEDMLSVSAIPDRAKGVGINGIEVDGMDVCQVYDAVLEAATKARAGEGPQFIAADCYRFEGHFSGDAMGYRDSAESDLWRERDPIGQLKRELLSTGQITEERFAEWESAAKAHVEEALAEAVEAPFPDSAQAWEDVYA